MRLLTIAVAYDGGEEARAALRAAQTIAARLGARLLLLAAIEPDAAPAIALIGAVTEINERLRERLERVLEQARSSLPPDLDVQTRVARGIGAPALAVAAETEGVDLLVCGSRGYGPLRSVLAGSVSRYLVDHAPCPVIVVPRGARAQLDHAPGQTAGAAATA
jgi:nucleotide-binding universal stress UspA family protein